MNYAKCATCHGLNSMGFCQYTACRFPEMESSVINASAFVQKIVTNADRIRAMSDEELAYFMANIEPCRESAWLDWLKQPEDEGFILENDKTLLALRKEYDRLMDEKFYAIKYAEMPMTASEAINNCDSINGESEKVIAEEE